MRCKRQVKTIPFGNRFSFSIAIYAEWNCFKLFSPSLHQLNIPIIYLSLLFGFWLRSTYLATYNHGDDFFVYTKLRALIYSSKLVLWDGEIFGANIVKKSIILSYYYDMLLTINNCALKYQRTKYCEFVRVYSIEAPFVVHYTCNVIRRQNRF